DDIFVQALLEGLVLDICYKPVFVFFAHFRFRTVFARLSRDICGAKYRKNSFRLAPLPKFLLYFEKNDFTGNYYEKSVPESSSRLCSGHDVPYRLWR
ncbi:MAG: hypothetical protein IJ734_02885, partial [Fibrobacter sp.]|nr:hypothetical protein [Fibrobacter sp.]